MQRRSIQQRQSTLPRSIQQSETTKRYPLRNTQQRMQQNTRREDSTSTDSSSNFEPLDESQFNRVVQNVNNFQNRNESATGKTFYLTRPRHANDTGAQILNRTTTATTKKRKNTSNCTAIFKQTWAERARNLKVIEQRAREESDKQVQDNKVTKLVRDSNGMFPRDECRMCFMPSMHRCTYGALFGKFFYVRDNQRICGKIVCNICQAKMGVESTNRCVYHNDKEEGECNF